MEGEPKFPRKLPGCHGSVADKPTAPTRPTKIAEPKGVIGNTN